MAWFAVMGADSVAYHEDNVLGRADDHPGQALDYYGTRGETPLRWAGKVAERLGLSGEVTPEAFRAVFGPGGVRHPVTGERLVKTTRPGFEIVVSAHKSLSLLGVIGRAEDMHAILDAQTHATLARLEADMQTFGGRRGRAAVVTRTTGVLYAVTRHGTSRAGDPELHDHILIANITWMLDAKGGWKGLFSALVRDLGEAACMAGRMAGAAKAIELGYAIELDPGTSGRARDWRIVGIPPAVCDIYSKRRDEIDDYIDEHGYTGYRARKIAARRTRAVKRFTGVDELLPRWRSELEAHGWTIDDLAAALDAAREQCTGLLPALTDAEIEALTSELMDPGEEFLTRWKVFSRSRLIAEIGPRLYGRHPDELDRVVDRVIASPEVVPLIGVSGARQQPYTAAAVLANEHTIADTIDRLIQHAGPTVASDAVHRAVAAKAAEVGRPLTAGQQAAIASICGPHSAVKIVVGVAGSGKTSALDAASRALEDAGYTIVGTATSGQAARTLGRQADVMSRTMRSLLWRLDHDRLHFTDRTVLVLDEAAMTADVDLARLLWHTERTRATVVLVGDPRQLPAVGPGGALAAVCQQHPEIVTVMGENVRQTDPAERRALAQLRHGDIDAAVAFYATHDRITISPKRPLALDGMVDAWAADTLAGHDTLMLAWRRQTVADLNRFARIKAEHLGLIQGEDLVAPGGRGYAVGDQVVTLAPNPQGELVTSQRGQVIHVDHQTRALTLLTDDGRQVVLSGESLDADHLDHGYALTVHREQGATSDRAHYVAEGGGRQLAYVAMSRARHHTTVHAVADNLDQAIEDITDDWSTDRDQPWLTPTTAVGQDPRTQPLPAEPPARREEIIAELARLNDGAPPDVARDLAAARARFRHLEQDRADLDAGAGRWRDTPQGQAVRAVADAHRRLATARDRVEGARLLDRRRAQTAVQQAEQALADVHQQRAAIVRPAARALDQDITNTERQISSYEPDDRRRRHWLDQHPDRARRIHQLERELLRIDDPDRARLLDHLDQKPAAGRHEPGIDPPRRGAIGL
ncbi:MAG: MobF family relaxase [Acidimicrobiales bacterium]